MNSTVRRLFPFLAWPRPSAQALRKDALAGLSVGLVLVPQALAYATLAGMPPQTGLYAALIPSIIGVLWGSSPLLAVGPVALTSLLTFASLQPLAAPGSAEWVQLAIWLAIYSGLIQFALGALRLGAVANFVSFPVISGFINAASLIIIFSQLPALLGLPSHLDLAWFGRAAQSVRDAPLRFGMSAAFGVGAFVLLFVQKKLAPRLPGVLIVCLLGITLSAWIGYAQAGAAVVGDVPGGLPGIGWPPSIGFAQHRALIPAAIIIALISFTEAMSSCRTLARGRNERWDENQELIGQGLAKIASGASGAFPVSGSFSRSALNAYVGATSAWSTLFSAACVTVVLAWLTGYLYHLPRAVLAAVIIVPVLSLIDVAVFKKLWRASREDGIIAITTFVVTLASVPYLHWGVFVGFFISLLFFLYRRARPRIVELGAHDDGSLRARDVFGLPPLAPDIFAVRMDAAISYISAPVLERFILDHVTAVRGLRTVLLSCAPVNDIDATGLEMLQQLRRNLGGQGITLQLAGLRKQVRDALERTGIAAEFGKAAFYPTEQAAIRALNKPLPTPPEAAQADEPAEVAAIDDSAGRHGGPEAAAVR